MGLVHETKPSEQFLLEHFHVIIVIYLAYYNTYSFNIRVRLPFWYPAIKIDLDTLIEHSVHYYRPLQLLYVIIKPPCCLETTTWKGIPYTIVSTSLLACLSPG